MLKLFYFFKPLIPRPLQIWLRRFRATRILGRLGGRLVDEKGLRQTEFTWPKPYRAGILITHDVELAAGQKNIPRLVDIEDQFNVKSCWNFVVDRYPIDLKLIQRLQEQGHEIGIHGLKHDGKLFSSPSVFRKRLPTIKAAAKSWGAVGFRSPALLYDLNLLSEMDFVWDSSIPAWDPFQPMPGGCGKYQPYMLNQDCVEFPVTMWQDFTLFEELQIDPMVIWSKQAELIIAAGGLVNIIIHPDYFLDESRLETYSELLGFLSGQEDVWLTTPGELADWVKNMGI